MGDNHAAKVWREVEPKNMGALSNAEAFIDDVDARIDDDDGEVCYDLLVKLVGFTKLLDEKVRNLVRFYDDQIGTPCEQIRHQHEVEEMKAQHERIVAGLEGRAALAEGRLATAEAMLREANMTQEACAAAYRKCPELPVTVETMEQATDALTAFCMAIGGDSVIDAFLAQESERDGHGRMGRES